MRHVLAHSLIGVWCFFVAFPHHADAQPIDQWHYIDTESVLYAERVDGLQGAGVIQNDATFAMLYLGLPEENGVVSVALPTETGAAQISSTLITTRGQRFDRDLALNELDVARISDTTFAYSFPITAVDVELFKSAQTWILSIGEKSWPITLTGSRAAIEEAERKRSALFKELAASQAKTETVSAD